MGLFEELRKAATEHNTEHGVPTFRLIPMNMACPLCAGEVPLTQNPASRNITCAGNPKHEFRDSEELRAYNLRPLKNAPPPPVTAQAQHTKIELSIPNHVHGQLQARFGAKLNSSAGAVLAAMVQPDSYVVSGEDAARISKELGQKVRDGQGLYGAVYALNKTKASLLAEVENFRTGNPVNTAGDIVLALDAGTTQVVAEKAKFNNKTPAQYIVDFVVMAAKNSWL